MGRLSAALTDRARVIRRVATGARVEGRTPTGETFGSWTACRLVPADAPERDDGLGLRRVIERAELVTGPGLDVQASDDIEVQSRLLGNGRWEVVGAPRAAASSRRVRAVVIPLQRTVEP